MNGTKLTKKIYFRKTFYVEECRRLEVNMEEIEKVLSVFFWGKKGMGERFSMKKLVSSIEEKALLEAK
jgi:hypothetical protein